MKNSVNKKLVLLIEDDEFLAGLLEERFKKERINFDLAVDAETGLSKVHENKPDLIILDLILPGADGYEFLEKLKADKKLASVPVVVLSNLGQKSEIERAMKLGAKGFLVKAHFGLDEIVQKIKKFLRDTQQAPTEKLLEEIT